MLRIGVFGSGQGTILQALLNNNDSTVEVVFSDRPCRFLEIGKNAGIPSLMLPYEQEGYDAKIAALLPPGLDFLILAGYMRLVKKPLLDAYPNRILNVHPADLQAVDERGRRKYTGANSVFDALSAGERKTRSTVIAVDEGMDTGRIICFGPWVTYSQGEPVTRERARRHQEIQKKESDIPALQQALSREGAFSAGKQS